MAAARSAADRSTTPAADIFRVGFERAGRGASTTLEAAVDRERQQVALSFKRGLWILGTIGATTPFVGLFGTVAGIMRCFKDLGLDVQAGGTGGSAAVMTGISEALVATAAGIVVAVEAVVLYNTSRRAWAGCRVELKLIAEEFVELLREQGAAQPASRRPPSVERGGVRSPAPPPASGGALTPWRWARSPGRRRRPGDDGVFAEINITPLTDIFLVLLIIFMVTSSVIV